MEWISESTALPRIGEKVLLLVPRQYGECWDMHVAWLAVNDEDVVPYPVTRGTHWPTDFWWNTAQTHSFPVLVTGNAWWSAMGTLPVPPGAEHRYGIQGEHYFAQPTPVWVGQR